MALTEEQKDKMREVIEYVILHPKKPMKIRDILKEFSKKSDEQVLAVIDNFEFNKNLDLQAKIGKREITI